MGNGYSFLYAAKDQINLMQTSGTSTTTNIVAARVAKELKWWQRISLREIGHTLLDVIGLIPIVGELADGINALWYYAEGDYLNAALSAGAMLPVVGSALIIGKFSAKAAKGIKKIKLANEAAEKIAKETAEEATEKITKEGAETVAEKQGDEVVEEAMQKEVAAKGVQTTLHGAERVAGTAATRGGVLSVEGINATKTLGKAFSQGDGATVFLHEITPGRFNAVVEGNKGIITTMENWSQKSINRIAKNYGWKLD
jgi:hypothetical protein